MKKFVYLLLLVALAVSSPAGAFAPQKAYFTSGGIAPITPVDPSTITSGLTALYDVSNAGSLTLSGSNVLSINDLSGNARHLTGTNNPVYTSTGGAFITFNGTNNYLSRSSTWLYSGGAATIIAVFKSNGGSGLALIGEGRSTTGNPLYQVIRSHFSNGTDDVYGFIRNDANTNILLNTSPLGNASVFDNTQRIITITDSGSLMTSFDQFVQGSTPVSYTRSDPTTLDRFAVGALVRNTVSAYVPGDFYYLVTWNRVLTQSEREGAVQFLKNKYGI